MKMKEELYSNHHYMKCLFSNIEFLTKKYINFTLKVGDKDEIKKNLNENKFEVFEVFNENKKKLEKLILDSKDFIAIEYLKNVFLFNDLEFLCFCISIMIKFSKKYEDMFELIGKEKEDNIIKIAIKIYYFKFELLDLKEYYNILNETKNKINFLCFDKDNKIDEMLFNFIVSNANFDFISENIRVEFPDRDIKKIIRKEIINKIIKTLKTSEKKVFFFIKGNKGSGKKFLLKYLTNKLNICLITIDVESIFLLKCDFEKILIKAIRIALITKGVICFLNSSIFNREKYKIYMKYIFNKTKDINCNLFFLSDTEVNYKLEDNNNLIMEINIEEFDFFQKLDILKDIFLELNLLDKVAPQELLSIFNLDLDDMNSIKFYLKNLKFFNKNIEKKDITEYIKKIRYKKFDSGITRVNSYYEWKDLIINESEKEILLSICNRVKNRNLIFDIWGLNKIAINSGVSILFSGPSGTGKTMAANVVANKIGLDLYKVDISQIMSKYIGETEKNLRKIFEEAKKTNIILLFDEMDSIFSKRCEIKDSKDRNSNIEISYLLQKMEEYDGICIMTTNFLENIDKAFFRRITYTVHFNIPDINKRLKIWEMSFANIPLDKNIDFKFISKFEITGAIIKNIVVSSAFFAVENNIELNKKINMTHILRAIKYELKKQGRILTKNEFGEYSHLIK